MRNDTLYSSDEDPAQAKLGRGTLEIDLDALGWATLIVEHNVEKRAVDLQPAIVVNES